MKRVILLVPLSVLCIFAIVCTAAEQASVDAARPTLASNPQFSLGYVYQGATAVAGGGWFGLNGARADLLLPITQRWGVTTEFSGVNTNNMTSSATALTLFTYMAGPRYSLPLHRRRGEADKITTFLQVLFGGVHASEGAFPSGSTLRSRADSFAMSAGGGVEVSLRHRISLRLIQAEYLYTRLPNVTDNYQNNYRIGAGVVLRMR